jgi:hypothetical protein
MRTFFKEWTPLYVYRTGSMVKVCIEYAGYQNEFCECCVVNVGGAMQMRRV